MIHSPPTARSQLSDPFDPPTVLQPTLFDSDTPDNRLREPLSAAFASVPRPWSEVTDAFLRSPAGSALAGFVDDRVRAGATVYPRQVFNALTFVPPLAVRVVVLGQDPYHRPGQAQGLAFSVTAGWRPLPPSLRNILSEVERDTGRPSQCRDDLTPWAEQGVLLLNTVLTVEDGTPLSHAGRGWEQLTDALLMRIADQDDPVIFMLWGGAAQKKQAMTEASGRHRALVANHPSPLAARRPPLPFVGCGHFGQANALLAALRPGSPPMRW